MEKQELKKEIGERLRLFRKKLGYTQDNLASYLAVTPVDISRIECGDGFPTPDMLQLLSKELNLSLHWLLFNEGEMNKTGFREINVNYPQSEDLEYLFICLEKLPELKQALLTFYFGYKARFYDIISELLKSSGLSLRSF